MACYRDSFTLPKNDLNVIYRDRPFSIFKFRISEIINLSRHLVGLRGWEDQPVTRLLPTENDRNKEKTEKSMPSVALEQINQCSSKDRAYLRPHGHCFGL
jgi:hypothetical protein